MVFYWILMAILFGAHLKDQLLDVDYKWWRKWIGEEPRVSGGPGNYTKHE